jgi:hypothetical protein
MKRLHEDDSNSLADALSTPISPANFYPKKEESQPWLDDLVTIQESWDHKFGKVFYKQSEVFQFCDQNGPSYKAWAKEGSKRGVRQYFVCSPSAVFLSHC